MSQTLTEKPQGEIVIYRTEDGQNRIQVRMEGETVWLTQLAMAELYQTTKQNVSFHIQNIYEERELTPEATVKKYLTVRQGQCNFSRCRICLKFSAEAYG
ncbi:hypothetical protein LLH00_17520 [bacterium]|nr:hypothetical protein [bacterium]